MRYFLISVECIINKTIDYRDSICLCTENFPSLPFIKKQFISSFEKYSGVEVVKCSGLFITNLFEFKNEKDYNDYNGIETPPIEKEMD